MRPFRHPFNKAYFWSIRYKKQVAGGDSILFRKPHRYIPNMNRETLFKRLESRNKNRYRRRRDVRLNCWMLSRNDRGCRQHVIRGLKWKRKL